MRIKTDPSSLRLMEAFNQSMSGSFSAGDTLLVDTSKTAPRIDAVLVLEINDEIYIRRVQRGHDGGYILTADCPSFLPMPVCKQMLSDQRILGEVVWAWSSKPVS